MEGVAAILITVVMVSIFAYMIGMVAVMVVGTIAVLLAKPATRLYSTIMKKRGVKWSFVPSRNVLVIDDDGTRVERDTWGSGSSAWSAAGEEWIDATFILALIWPYALFALVYDWIRLAPPSR